MSNEAIADEDFVVTVETEIDGEIITIPLSQWIQQQKN